MMFLMPLADDGPEERALWEEKGDLETNTLDWGLSGFVHYRIKTRK